MKRLLIIIGLLLAVAAGGNSLPTKSSAAALPRKERAVALFREPVKLLGVVLQGEYMFVHDDEAMARGDACTYVYKLQDGKADKLVVAFHCIPAPRKSVSVFTVRTSFSATLMLNELTEYQFAGSTEAHQVPATGETQAKSAIVNLIGCCL